MEATFGEDARNEAEVRFRSITETAFDAIVCADEHGTITGWNPASERMFGYCESEVLNQRLTIIMPERYRDLHERAFAHFRETGEATSIGMVEEREGLRKDGAVFPLELVTSTWIDVRGVRNFTAIIRDITERKALEETRAREREQLQRAYEEAEAFNYSVSHDLRAPLRAIDGFSRRLLRRYEAQLDEAAVDDLRRVCAAASRMGELIDDLLNLSRISRREPQRRSVDLSQIVRSAAAECANSEPQREVELAIEPGLTAQADPALLQIAFQNLVGNAWKFTAQSPHAKISFGRAQADGNPDTVYFLRDNGAGFDMRYAEKLFKPFQRLHSSREFDGNGIGLATVSRILQRHGGRIWAQSAPGSGATFFFTLPSEGHAA